MTFARPTHALLWWWLRCNEWYESHGFPPAHIDPDYVNVQSSIQCWDYPDEWYDWIEIKHALKKITRRDRQIILSYLQEGQYLWDTWRYKQEWSWVCRRFWENIPGELKRGYYGFNRPKQALYSQGNCTNTKGYACNCPPNVQGRDYTCKPYPWNPWGMENTREKHNRLYGG